jgi:hypothetical protein
MTPDLTVTSETPIERKEITCEMCGAKRKEKCECKQSRRYKFGGEDEWGENFEVRPSADSTPVPFQAQMLGPQFIAGTWEYSETDFDDGALYGIRLSISWRSLFPSEWSNTARNARS